MKKSLEKITTALIKKCSTKVDRSVEVQKLIEEYYKYHTSTRYDLQNLTDKRNAMQKIYLATPDDERFFFNKFSYLVHYEVLALLVDKYNSEAGDH